MAELNENIQRKITQYVECLTCHSPMNDDDYNNFSNLLSHAFDIVLSARGGEEDDFYIKFACNAIKYETRNTNYVY